MSRIAFLTRVFARSPVVPPQPLLSVVLGALPGGPPEAADRRLLGPGVLLDQNEPLHRDEELVLAGVAELHELLRLTDAHDDLLQPDELSDPVVYVDDVVA